MLHNCDKTMNTFANSEWATQLGGVASTQDASMVGDEAKSKKKSSEEVQADGAWSLSGTQLLSNKERCCCSANDLSEGRMCIP